jgi:ABC-type transporter Mla maintaining outer membrane lipid asymmetry ATPase subunit MlaF
MPTSQRFESGILRGDIRAEILSFDEVSISYGAETILERLSFNVRRGEVAGLVALDGRGKSTLVRCAAGLLPPIQGTVRFETRDVYGMTFAEDQRYRSRSAAVFEGGALFQNRTVLQNVSLPLRYHAGGTEEEAEKHARRLLERTGYTESFTAFPFQVSARGRHLAAIARALVRDPELVVIDRFYESLEAQDMKRLMELVLELNVNKGTSFLLVGELQPAIFQVAERVVVLEAGRIVAHDFKRGLYKNPRIKNAFETGEGEPPTRRPWDTDGPKPRPAKATKASKPAVPPAPAPATPAPASPSLSDSDVGEEKTFTMSPDAAQAVIAEARRRADDRIEAEARKLEQEARPPAEPEKKKKKEEEK